MKIFTKFLRIFQNASPGLKNRIAAIFSLLFFSNLLVWLITLSVFHKYFLLLGLVTLAYGLGLRHAVDADHIAAIDNTTRKLMRDGKRPVAVGFFFSLGHSTIVIALSFFVALSAAFVKQHLPAFQTIGSLIGTAASSVFLLLIGIINFIALIDIFKIWRHVTKGESYNHHLVREHLETRGFLTRLFRPVLKTIHTSWHMYFVGLLFGLGFDTASEVALLSISGISGASGMPLWAILLLPFAFTAGMALIDTLDGILMLGAYGWAYVKPIRKLYYNMNITLISVVIAVFIGGIEAVQILSRQLHLSGNFFQAVNNLDFGNLGYIIIAIFLFSWIFSILFYNLKHYDLRETQ